MDEQIKEYLSINASKYAEFKGINPDFINNTESPEYKEYYETAISYLEKGGLIPKMAEGDIILEDDNPNWEGPLWFLKHRKLKYLTGWTKDLDASQAGGNLPQNKYHRRYGSLQGAFATNNAYTSNKDLIGQDLNTYYNINKTSYKDLKDFVSKYNLNAGQIRGMWNNDAITHNYKTNSEGYRTHNQLFRQMFANRSGSTNNDWDLGYSESSENVLGSTTWMRNMDLYEKEWDKLTDEEKKNRVHKIGDLGYVYKKANGDIEVLNDDDKTRLGLTEGTPTNTESTNTEGTLTSGLPTVPTNNPLLKLKGKIDPTDVLNLASFIDSYRTNKDMKNLFQKEYSWAPEEYTSKHLNIYGDLGSLNQGYNAAANTRSYAGRIGSNTSDLRTGLAAMLQGNKNAGEQEAQARQQYNQLVRSTQDAATKQEFDNIDRQQTVANENRNRQIAAHNVRLNNLLEYKNQQFMNRKAYLDAIALKSKTKEQDAKDFKNAMLQKQYDAAVENDPLVKQAREAYEKSQDSAAWNRYVQVKKATQERLSDIFYREMARNNGYTWSGYNPFSFKSGGTISDDGPRKTRSKTLERHRKSQRDLIHYNDKKLDRLGKLTYLYAKRAQGKKK